MNPPTALAPAAQDNGIDVAPWPALASRPWRGRVTATVVAVVGLVLVVGVVLAPMLLRARLVADVDDALRSRVVDLSAMEGQPIPEVLVGTGGAGAVAQVLQSPGTVVGRSANLEGASPIIGDVPLPGQTSLASTELTVAGATDRYRVAALTLESAPEVAGRTVVVAGTSLQPVEDTVTTVRRLMGVGLVAVLAIVGVATWIAAGRTGAADGRDHSDRSHDTGDGHVGPVLRNELRQSLGATQADLDRGLALPITTDWVDLAHRQRSQTERLLDRLDAPDDI